MCLTREHPDRPKKKRNASHSRNLWLLVLIAGLVYSAAFTYTALRPSTRYMGDSFEYLDAGWNLLEHGILYGGDLEDPDGIEPALYSRRPPLYPIVLAVSRLATGGPILAVLIQMGMTALGAALLWKLGGHFSLERGARFVAVSLYLLFPAQVIYSQVIMAEVLLQFLLLGSVFLMVRYLAQGRPRSLYLCNLALGLSVLCKPVMMFFWAPNLVFLGWLYLRKRSKHLLVAPLIPLLLQSAWSFRNFQVTGYYHFTSMTASYAALLSRPSRAALEEEEDFGDASGAALEAFARRLPERYPVLLKWYSIRLGAFFLDPGRFDLYEFLDEPHSASLRNILFGAPSRSLRRLERIPILIILLLVGLTVLNALILAGFVAGAWRRFSVPWSKIFLCLVVFYIAAVTSFAGASRYRLAVEPLLLVMAAPFLHNLSRRLIRRNVGGDETSVEAEA